MTIHLVDAVTSLLLGHGISWILRLVTGASIVTSKLVLSAAATSVAICEAAANHCSLPACIAHDS